MAKFKVINTFTVKQKNYFVITGTISSGKIEKGMFLFYKFLGKYPLKLHIDEINFIDKIENGEMITDVALCIKVKNEALLKVLPKFDFIGKTFNLFKRKRSYSYSTLLKSKLEITSCRKKIMHTKLLKGTNLIPGTIYTFNNSQNTKSINAFYTKKDYNYYTFYLLEEHSEIESGSTIQSKEIMVPHK